jgi:hypothetical protein
MRATATWQFDAESCALTWKERERVVRPGVHFGTFAIATRLAFTGGTEARLECTCAPGEATCTHALALIDATLDLLEDPARLDEARTVATELLRPGWSRALAELARFDDDDDRAAAKPSTAIEVWWRIEHELGTLTLTPTVKKQTRRGTLTAGARMSVARLLDDHREALPEQDLRIAEQFVAWSPEARGATTYPVRALLALVGHPRIITDASSDPVELARVPLGFTALAAGDLIRLEPSVEGTRFSPRLLGSLLGAFGAGEPLFTVDPVRDRLLLIEVGDDARRLWNVLDKHGDAFPPESHAPLLERLARRGHALASLATRHASLEDVFVSLTGRHLRDE